MDNVVEFPTEYQPEISESSAFNLTKTLGYERHQGELRDWLSQVSQQEVAFQNIFLGVMGERYGYPPVDQELSLAWSQVLLKEDPRTSAFDLQNHNINAIICSPILSVYQKVDLLTISAEALSNGKHPADGRKVVLKNLEEVKRLVNRRVKQDGTTGSPGRSDLFEHFEAVATLVDENLPKLTRREFYKHAASTISGERVTSTIRALGIVTAAIDSPNPKKIEESAHTRKDRVLKKAEKRAVDANARLAKLREDL